MITVSLVSGLLGAGKSTWLAARLEGRRPGLRVVVNDVADEMPDADLIDGPAVTRILGGCICCQKTGELVDVLLGFCEERHAGGQVDSVVIEASGLAEPTHLAELIRTHPVLARNVVLDEVVVVVDGLLGRQSLAHEPLALRQIDAADLVVVTKTDLCDTELATDAVAVLQALAPTAEITIRPNPHQLDPRRIRPAEGVQRVTNADESPATATSLSLNDPVDWVVLAAWLSALLQAHGDAVLRVKGSVSTVNGRLGLNAVRGVMHAPRPAAHTTDRSSLVIVSRGIDPDHLTAGWARFCALADRRTIDHQPSRQQPAAGLEIPT